VLLVAAPAAAVPAPSAPSGAPARKGERPLTLFYGDTYCFGVVIPEGWVADDTSGMGAKIRVVFYPRGQNWSTATTVMYVNPIHQPAGAVRSLAQTIDHDVAEFRKHAPQGSVTPAPAIRTRSGQLGQVRYFAADGDRPTEAVAYLEEKDLVNLIVLSSRQPDAFQHALGAFHDLVFQYRYVGGNLRTPTAPADPAR